MIRGARDLGFCRLRAAVATDFDAAALETVRVGSAADEFKLTICQRGGTWTIDIDQAPHDDRSKLHGAGSNFAAAWNAMTSLAVEPLNSPPLPRRLTHT